MPPYDKTSEQLYQQASSHVTANKSSWNCARVSSSTSSGLLTTPDPAPAPSSSLLSPETTTTSFRTHCPPRSATITASCSTKSTSSCHSSSSSSSVDASTCSRRCASSVSSSLTSSSSSASSTTIVTITAAATTPQSPTLAVIPRHFGERLAVEGSLRAILLCLEHHGISRGSLDELQKMIPQHRYLRIMARAEEYVECLYTTATTSTGRNSNMPAALDDLDAILELFLGGWAAIIQLSRCLYKDAYKAYTQSQDQQWEEFIVQQSSHMSDRQKLARQRRNEAEWEEHPNQQAQLKAKWCHMTRAKIECEKGFYLAQEWARSLRLRVPQEQRQQQQLQGGA